MYKVILVEDEVYELEYLKNSIDWKSFNMEVTGCFNYAQDAIDFINNNPADIVITDIRMPGKSGLDMIEAIKQRDNNTEFIIISAFSDFKYMQSAIANKVFNYILKPIDFSEFEATLKKLSAKLEKSRFISVEDMSLLHCQQVINNYFADKSSDADAVISVLEENNIFIDKDSTPVALLNITINDFIHYISDTWSYGIDKLHTGIINILSADGLYLIPFRCSYNIIDLLAISKHKSKADFDLYLTDLLRQKKDELFNIIKAETDISVYRIYDSIADAQKNLDYSSLRPQTASAPVNADAISKAVEYINANYSRDISLSEISDYVSFSPYYFSRYFKNKTGETFSNYINRIRVEKARELLETTDNSIVSIAREVGYNSKNHFYHMFKLYYSCTPNEYRSKRSD